MIGKKFGKWEVLNQIDNGKPGKHYECQCKCGNIRIKAGTELRAGKGKQCRECQYKKLYDPTKLIGKRFGSWTINKYLGIHRKLMQFETQCDCGVISKHLVCELRSGKSRQCINCHNKENAERNKKHGMHKTKIYNIWQAMHDRCRNPNCKTYNRYGGRGIKVCERWNEFKNFFADMGERPQGLTLDRIDNDGDYEPSNCRWVTHKENCNNRYY